MPDHVHLLASFPTQKEMTVVIKEWKAYTAKATGVRWQRGFFDHRLRREESLRDKSDYILQNPVRKGLVAQAEDWPHAWMPEGMPSVGSSRRLDRECPTAGKPAACPYRNKTETHGW
jgi:hypothetical protein